MTGQLPTNENQKSMEQKTRKPLSKEDKELLYIDLSARLPYGVRFITTGSDFPFKLEWLDNRRRANGDVRLEHVIPILRPIPSMTMEELKVFNKLLHTDYHFITPYRCNTLIRWLNKNMFDFNELIPNGIALSTEEFKFNPYKNQ